MNNFECEQFLELTLSLGRQYVETGAEIKRVEDSLYRIYKAYGFENIECNYKPYCRNNKRT